MRNRVYLFEIIYFKLQLPDIGGAVHVWVQMYIIGVQMMLYHMLMNPVNLRSTYPVFSQAKKSIYKWIFANCAMISIMLNIEA